MCLVFFDFDRTITTRDTILPLGLHLTRIGSRHRLKTLRLLWALFLLKGRVLSNISSRRSSVAVFSRATWWRM